ncbi:hypothetical protein ACFS4T_19510 [Pseudomonas lini]
MPRLDGHSKSYSQSSLDERYDLINRIIEAYELRVDDFCPRHCARGGYSS